MGLKAKPNHWSCRIILEDTTQDQYWLMERKQNNSGISIASTYHTVPRRGFVEYFERHYRYATNVRARLQFQKEFGPRALPNDACFTRDIIDWEAQTNLKLEYLEDPEIRRRYFANLAKVLLEEYRSSPGQIMSAVKCTDQKPLS